MKDITINTQSNFKSINKKADIFINNISERVNYSLDFVKTQYTNYPRFELAVNFIDYHHSDAIKADIIQIARVGYYPATEAEMELDYSIKHALIASYKSAFADLRRALELTLTSVYMTSSYTDPKKAFEWITSSSDTPYFSTILKKIINEHRFKDFNDKHDWVNNLKQFYWNLSNFSHNKGQLKGYRELNGTNYFAEGTSGPSANIKTLSTFCDLYIQTVEEIVMMLALYNPMILVGVPLDEKFGLDPPASGYYNDIQANLVHQLIPDKFKPYFLDIANNDEEVKSAIKWFNSLPDLTDEDLKEQERQLNELFQDLPDNK